MPTRERLATYKSSALQDEASILAAAENILRGRLERLGCLTAPEDSAAFLRFRLAGLPHEEFHCVFLDNRHRILAVEGLFRGTINASSVHPREVVKSALKHNASAVVLAHNHPSGDPTPSAADRSITQQLKEALALVEVRLLDHIVVGAEGTTSLAQRGWL
jgi:DNA repair protein RadC